MQDYTFVVYEHRPRHRRRGRGIVKGREGKGREGKKRKGKERKGKRKALEGDGDLAMKLIAPPLPLPLPLPLHPTISESAYLRLTTKLPTCFLSTQPAQDFEALQEDEAPSLPGRSGESFPVIGWTLKCLQHVAAQILLR